MAHKRKILNYSMILNKRKILLNNHNKKRIAVDKY